ncbi:MAG: agmatine deiminase family protein [Luminiphilus sp.]|nr:agmatine deiminase family protein [Luminiphilus sp.]
MTRTRYMPPEWATHAASWMGFPRDSYAESGLNREAAQDAWSAVANAISDYEPVKMLCHPEDLAAAKRKLSASIDLIPVTLNDAWLRDIGPTFVMEDDALVAIDWQFNGWGQNTEFEWDHDDTIARQIAEVLTVPSERAEIVNEGGGIHVDGHGTVLLTDTVQLDPTRNSDHDRDSIETHIHNALGTHRAIWLPRGLWRDNFLNGTKGHVDIVACFAPDGRLLVHRQTIEGHPDFALWDDLAQQFSDEGLEVFPLEAPLTLRDHRDWVDYSYINHYVCNGAVICPSFDDPRDDAARERLEDAYPGRDIRMLDARALFAMGGGIHCITQQQPSGVG